MMKKWMLDAGSLMLDAQSTIPCCVFPVSGFNNLTF